MKKHPQTETKPKPKLNHPLEIYLNHLRAINGVSLTHREIDVISCFLNMNGRSRQYVANFLSMALRTVNTHINNVKQKFGCDIGNVMLLLEKSDQFLILKERYYLSLLIDNLFKETLKEVNAVIPNKRPPFKVILIYWDKKPPFLNILASDLAEAGLVIFLEGRHEMQTFDQLIQEVYQDSYPIYFFPESLTEETQTQSADQALNIYSSGKIFFFQERIPKYVCQEIQMITCINVAEWSSYYSSIFVIINKIFLDLELTEILEKFENKAYKLRNSLSSLVSMSFSEPPLRSYMDNGISTFRAMRKLEIKKLLYTLIPILSVILFLFLTLDRSYIIKSREEKKPEALYQGRFIKQENVLDLPVRSDLIIPSERTLLNRQHLIDKIKINFQNQQQDIQVVALVGIGGSGKTILARQYALSQKFSPIAWEINAETQETLKDSFENLAYMLLTTDEEKKFLRDLRGVKDQNERENKIIQLVKRNFKSHENWLLIYDNVKQFKDLQNYFPSDCNVWGKGKVIVTTQDNHIQYNNYVQCAIPVEELTQQEKLELFFKIINRFPLSSVPDEERENVKDFLNNIPSFPLDVSTSAHYLKSTNISYSEYVNNLKECKTEFVETQKNILKGSSEYKETRWGIIALSLKDFIDKQGDFCNLLLLISFLDPYSIPRDLLVKYKKNMVVDNFIYYMKKYSLINVNDESLHQLFTFSIHKNIHNAISVYLVNKLKLEKGSPLVEEISDTLESYSHNTIKKEEMLKMKILQNHYNHFLRYSNLLTNNMIGIINGELGVISFFQSKYKEAQKHLNDSVALLDTNNPKIARYYGFLGNSYRELGDYQNSKLFLEKCLKILQEHHVGEKVDLPWAYVNLGIMYKYLEDYKNAKIFIEKALEIQKKKPADPPHTAWILGHLGSVYSKIGDNIQSKNLFEQSLSIYEKYFGENHPKLAWILMGLGITYRNMSNYKKSKDLLEKSILINKMNFSEDNLKIVLASMELGKVYLLEGNLQMAEDILNKSIIMLEKQGYLDMHIPLTILAELNLKKSQNMSAVKNRKEAQEFEERAIRYIDQAIESLTYRFPKNSLHIIELKNKRMHLSGANSAMVHKSIG